MDPASDADRQRRLAALLAHWLPPLPEALATLARYVRPVSYPAGAVLVAEGEPADDLVLLETGVVRAYVLRHNKEVNHRLLNAPAAALAYRSHLQGRPADETLQALSPVQGLKVAFRRYRTEHPGLLAETFRRVLAETHAEALQRRLDLLQGRSAAQRYAYFLRHQDPQVIATTPGFHIASYLGITPESLSRVRARLEKDQ
ncbi:MAG TPA: Crp/Fnr family transcriptional regulator [Nevskiaceae bacterium]|nr:Crp/Fnr family transcriptional regulator [Nevskiaceae bacterium]